MPLRRSRRGGVNWKILVIGLLPVAALIAVLQSGFGSDPRALPSMLEGRAAPRFTLERLDGGTLSLDELKGRPVVINFWATWCRPCAAEHPILLDAAERYAPRGVVFLGVLYGDEASNAVPYLERHGSAYPTLLDPGQRTALDFGVGGVPETFFVSPDGEIVDKITGPVSGPMIAEILERML